MATLLVAFLAVSFSLLGISGKKFNAIFNFGDSLSDTGNICANGTPAGLTFGHMPNGQTFFHKASCGCSDGRLIIDFLAQRFGLPLLPPSKKSGADFKKGANMAITGATAMDGSFFKPLGVFNLTWNNGPLNTQIQWFQQLLPSICGSTQACQPYLANSLFVLGEFGGNDYNALLFGKYSPEQASSHSAAIVDTIGRSAEQLISLGAKYMVIPGVLPIGCMPTYLTIYETPNTRAYDQFGCLASFNTLSTHHNTLLQNKVKSLQSRHPRTKIMYADFYGHIYDMVKNPASHGFKSALTACCGAGGSKYNSKGARCGAAGATVCPDVSAALSWDGIHLTEAAYKQIADGWLNGPYCTPSILSKDRVQLLPVKAGAFDFFFRPGCV